MAEITFECPLLCRTIEVGLCMEIVMGVNMEIRKDAVPEVDDWEKAGRICPGCMAAYKNKPVQSSRQ